MNFNQNGSKWLQFTQDSFVLDIPSLERRWLKYKIKSYFPHFLISITAIGVIVALSTLYILNKSESGTDKANKPAAREKSPPKKIQNDTVILEPSMQFIQSISSNNEQPTIDTIQEPQKINIPTKIPQVKPESKPKVPLSVPNPSVAIRVPSAPIAAPPPIASSKTPTIKRESDTFDIHEIEERFKNNSNPHLGVYIARYHYDHGNYSEAYNYALKTNSISSTMEESWLIFAKSLSKLGKSDQAKKTLQLYISQSNSENAKSLLNSIEQGGVK